MAHFKYYWRLDTHSEISTKVDFDVFELMQKQNKKYGFAMLNVDPPKLVKYMDVWSANFMKTNKLTIADPKWFEEMVTTRQYAGRSLHFWNNFELVDLQWITSSDVLRYSRHMDTVGGIYSYRWGDAPLRTCALCVAPRLVRMCFPCEYGELLKTSLTKKQTITSQVRGRTVPEKVRCDEFRNTDWIQVICVSLTRASARSLSILALPRFFICLSVQMHA